MTRYWLFSDWPCGTYRWWSWWENNLPDCRWWWKKWIVGARRRDRTPGFEERSHLPESSPGPMDNRLELQSTGCCRSCPAPPRTPARKSAVNYLREVDKSSLLCVCEKMEKNLPYCCKLELWADFLAPSIAELWEMRIILYHACKAVEIKINSVRKWSDLNFNRYKIIDAIRLEEIIAKRYRLKDSWNNLFFLSITVECVSYEMYIRELLFYSSKNVIEEIDFNVKWSEKSRNIWSLNYSN